MAEKPKTAEGTEQQEERLYRSCLSKLQQYFDDEIDGGDEVKVAIQTANMLVKREQTAGAKEALRFAMAQSITRDPKELERYVHATQPQVKRALTGS